MTEVLSCEKDIAVVVSYPRIVKILGVLKETGHSEEEFPKWLGVILSKMLLISYTPYEVHKGIADILNNELGEFHSDVYHISLDLLFIVRNISINRIKMLSDNSIVFYLNKDKYD